MSQLSVNDYVVKIENTINDIKNNFFYLGLLFSEVKSFKLYEQSGYKDVFEFAEKTFHLGKSTVYNLININNRFASENKMIIDEKYKDFSYSQLTELWTFNDDDLFEKFNPEMSVRQIKELKRCKPLKLIPSDTASDSKRLENYHSENVYRFRETTADSDIVLLLRKLSKCDKTYLRLYNNKVCCSVNYEVLSLNRKVIYGYLVALSNHGIITDDECSFLYTCLSTYVLYKLF